MKVTVQKSDMAEFATIEEKDTSFQPYSESHQKTTTGRVTDDEIARHASDCRGILEVIKKVSSRNQTDDTSFVSSVKSSVSRDFRVCMPVKLLPPPPPTPTNNQKIQENPSTISSSRKTQFELSRLTEDAANDQE